jgi:hypothetical protein
MDGLAHPATRRLNMAAVKAVGPIRFKNTF